MQSTSPTTVRLSWVGDSAMSVAASVTGDVRIYYPAVCIRGALVEYELPPVKVDGEWSAVVRVDASWVGSRIPFRVAGLAPDAISGDTLHWADADDWHDVLFSATVVEQSTGTTWRATREGSRWLRGVATVDWHVAAIFNAIGVTVDTFPSRGMGGLPKSEPYRTAALFASFAADPEFAPIYDNITKNLVRLRDGIRSGWMAEWDRCPTEDFLRTCAASTAWQAQHVLYLKAALEALAAVTTPEEAYVAIARGLRAVTTSG